MKKIFSLLFRPEKTPKLSRTEEDRVKLNQDFRDQLIKLKEKGLSIPIFTL